MTALNDAAANISGANISMAGFGGRAAMLPSHDPVNTMGSLRRYTLVLLRWAAVAGQILTLLIVSLVLGFEYPVIACSFICLLYTSPSPRDGLLSRMPSSA